MDSQRAPDVPDRPSPTGEPEQQTPLQNVDNPLSARGREKKKVGFASDNEPQVGEASTSPFLATPELHQFSQDYFSFSPGDDTNATSTPMVAEGGPAKRDSFNKDELVAALAEILQPEHHGGAVPPSLPRPVLRKPTNVDSPTEAFSATPHRSEVEAKNRADRLAFAVGSSSAPASRRGSFDGAGVESGMSTPFDRESLLSRPEGAGSNPHEFSGAKDASGLRSRKGAQQAASDLVRRHTRRATPLLHQFTFPRSGTATPVSDDLENIPRPEKYKGGILGNLLKLYNDEDKNGSGASFSSAPSTPGRTPNETPSNTPPTSRPNTPRLGGRAGFRGSRPHSSTALAGLMETSFMFTAPGSRDISEAVSDKIKQERERTKKRTRTKKQEEFRITVHIAQIISRHQYLIKLCKSLMMYGAPTHRLEAYMKMSARVLSIEGQFMYLPGAMIISFDDSNTHTTEVKILRTPQGVDLGRLRDVHQIYKEVVHDVLGAEEAINRLNEVIDRSDKFPIWLRILLFGVASATVAPFGFEGRYIDMPLCFLLGCLVGFLQLFIAPSNELYANVFEITAAVATSFLSRVFGSININGGHLFCFSAMAQSSIALILPGYIVLCASLELQSHQMISGSVRMVYALIYSLFLGYGITIGSVIYGYIDPNAVSAVHCSVGEEWYTQRPGQDCYLLFVLPFTLCLCAINQAKWKQTPVMVLISLAGYCVNNFSSRHFRGNATLSNSLGALCIGVLANLYSRLGRQTQNLMLDTWERHLSRRVHRFSPWHKRRPVYYNTTASYSFSTESVPKDLEPGPPPPAEKGGGIARHTRRIGYGLAAAAMLPAIFVQVPSGLAVGGSLLSGVTSADQITRNETMLANGTMVSTPLAATSTSGDLNSTAFNVLFSVIQVAISISVGLSLSALIVYPFGKRRSGLFSF
ncbi:hypothetical protein B0T25DRAFT_442958 [Lasiosphaeria hispida]|uniref:Threonine/serine exporter-like N-terminal domain-containing protein n=1 Tax=Lasiosphaeria hispida TaxID=260671 RepID=A0AAJ0HT75_9PEZI|nr:hypothetical protein B0T25DRAFT_442958 [Lasiosphaeria hispida]